MHNLQTTEWVPHLILGQAKVRRVHLRQWKLVHTSNAIEQKQTIGENDSTTNSEQRRLLLNAENMVHAYP